MNQFMPPNLLRPWLPGARMDARKLSAISYSINRMNQGCYPPQTVAGEYHPLDTSPTIIPAWVTLDSVQQDYLTCHDQGSNTVYVAKPTMLRSTNVGPRNLNWTPATGPAQSFSLYYSAYSVDGQERLATRSGGDTELQIVDDAYQAGDVIWVIYISPLQDSGDENELDPNGNAIVLMDTNIDARHWAKIPSS